MQKLQQQWTRRSRYQVPHRENPRLRAHAVSIFHSDYSDDGTEDPFEEDEEDDQEEEAQSELARLIKKDEEERKAKQAKWNAPPKPQVTVIDEKGRSYGRGGRKASSAQVWIQPGFGEIVVNRRPFVQYFVREALRDDILQPLVVTRTCGKFDLQCMVRGGGLSGQAGAIRLGLARALNHYNPDAYRPALRRLGYLTRDPRKVERKKIGKVKARKSPQWVRR
jgi:small subunit ribosomal protein S9